MLLTAELGDHQDRVWCVAWSPTGSILASCGSDKTVRLYVEKCGQWTCTSVLDGAHSRTIRSVNFSPCGRYLVSASFDSTLVVYELKNGDFDVMSTLEGHENEVKCVAFSPSGRYLASCSRDKTVWVWEMDEDEEFHCCSILSSHSQDVKHVCWMHNEDVLVSSSYDDSVNFYKFDGDEWVLDQRLERAHEGTVWAACFSPDDRRLATVGADCLLKIWHRSPSPDDTRWRCLSALSGEHKRPVYHADWDVQTGALATASGDNCIRVFVEDADPESRDIGAKTGQYRLLQTQYDAHGQDVNCVRWHPKRAGVLASCSDDGTVKIWQTSPPF